MLLRVGCVKLMYESVVFFFFFKQKTAYDMRISDWSSDVCSSDLARPRPAGRRAGGEFLARHDRPAWHRPGGAPGTESAPHLRLQLRIWKRRTLPELSGDGSRHAGDDGGHQRHRLSRPAAGEGGGRALRLQQIGRAHV